MQSDNQDPKPTFDATAPSVWTRRLAMGSLAIAALTGIGLATATSGGFAQATSGLSAKAMHASMRGRHFGERGLDYMLEEIDATPEQATKLKAIFDSAHDEVMPMVADFRETRGQIADLLSSPTIDRAAAEKLRSERVAAVDEASRKVTAAVLDAAEVLTPQQRAQLAKHFKERGGHGRW